MRSRSARRVLVLLIAAGLVLSSCGGGGGSDETTSTPVQPAKQNLTAGLSGQKRDAAAAIEAYLAAFASGDPNRICPLTSRTDAALARCESTLPHFDPGHQSPFALRKIEIHGSRADASIVPRSGRGKPVFFQLRRVGGEWKIVVATLQG